MRRARPYQVLGWNLLLLTWGGAALAAALCLPAPVSTDGINGENEDEGELGLRLCTTAAGQQYSVPWSGAVLGAGANEQFRSVKSAPSAAQKKPCESVDTKRSPGLIQLPDRRERIIDALFEDERIVDDVPGAESVVDKSTDVPGRSIAASTAEIIECRGCTSPKPGVTDWFKRHRNREGYWCPRDFYVDAGEPGLPRTGNHPLGGVRVADTGSQDARVEATALVLCAFNRAGYDHKEGEYRKLCRDALQWLIACQDENGRVAGGRVREQALATMALAESYGLSADEVLKPTVEKAARYLKDGRTANGGWAEAWGGNGPDCVSTALAVLALKTVQLSGIELDLKDALGSAGAYMEQLVQPDRGYRMVRYSVAQERAMGPDGVVLPHRLPLCEACYVVTTLLSGTNSLESETIREFARKMISVDNLPAWEHGRIDTLYLWLATEALFQVGGKAWDVWAPALLKTVAGNQRGYSDIDKAEAVSDETGSWDATDAWGARGGRVYSTAAAVLALQIYYRFKRERSNTNSPQPGG